MDIPLSLSYRGSLRTSDATFSCVMSNGDIRPVEIRHHIANSSASSFTEGYFKQGVLAQDVTAYHLGRTELHPSPYCCVHFGTKQLLCEFSIKILSKSLKPNACDDPIVREYLKELAAMYAEKGGYYELAKRYAKNLLRGAWLWENIESESVTVVIKRCGQLLVKVKNAQNIDWDEGWDEYQSELSTLTELIANSFCSKGVCILNVAAYIDVEVLQEVLPSQLVPPESKRQEGKKRKISKEIEFAKTTLANDQVTVCLRKAKVGAGIQLIDDWCSVGEPLRVSEYGADKYQHLAFRTPQLKNDIYALLPNVPDYIQLLKDNQLGDNPISQEIHFVMAILVKGAVLNRKSDKEDK
ncbi:type I-F CRISPR-associated protein Csy3 [Shewanella sp. 202IG2-18]|uniref:type I-F CRISPR-associated protein Csy3 n=1 Tax=Parashewanella hymeniacidonis TaxID=2807618 RepID=UPI001960AC72|nr:type I-F CRISPR-associated protein Csy3 [Parashewanella hymeniacidonis]MBM7070676.1 type I-F CRISPR-associated protein Csy3 [Parashewanella hymeniacidonis]